MNGTVKEQGGQPGK